MVTKKAISKAKNIKGLSKAEAGLLLRVSDKKIFSLDDVLEELDCTYDYAKVLVNRLVKKEWLIRLDKGKYLVVPLSAGVERKYTEHSLFIGSRLVSPSYIGFWSALGFYGFTEQVPPKVFVVTTKRKKEKKILGVSYRFVTLGRKKFFGYSEKWSGGNRITMSDKEKTLIDCLDHPEYCGGINEAAKGLWNGREEVSLGKLLEYAEKSGNGAIVKRLGYIAESLNLYEPDQLHSLRKNLTKGYVVLDPLSKAKGKYNSRWKLIVNQEITTRQEALT